MNCLTPDIIAEIHMYSTKHGGKKKVIHNIQFGCPLFYQGEGFDCRILLDQVGASLGPGQITRVPIKFLFPELIKSRLTSGDQFTLWDAGIFAEGKVIEVVKDR